MNPFHVVSGHNPYLNYYAWFFNIPLYLVLSAMALPTAYLYWRDRRRIPPGHCQRCGYNLFSNVSGRCPECGEVCELDVSEIMTQSDNDP